MLLSLLGKTLGPSFEQTWIPFNQECSVPSLADNRFWRVYFVAIFSTWKRVWPFIRTNFNDPCHPRMLSAKCTWNLPNGPEENLSVNVRSPNHEIRNMVLLGTFGIYCWHVFCWILLISLWESYVPSVHMKKYLSLIYFVKIWPPDFLCIEFLIKMYILLQNYTFENCTLSKIMNICCKYYNFYW